MAVVLGEAVSGLLGGDLGSGGLAGGRLDPGRLGDLLGLGFGLELLLGERVRQAPGAALLLEGADLLQGDVLQAAVDVLALRLPEGVGGAGPLIAAFLEADQALVAPLGAVHGLGDEVQGDLLGGQGQHHAALVAALGHHQAHLGQLVDHLGEVGPREAGTGRHIHHQGGLAARILEAAHGEDRITRGLGQWEHGHLHGNGRRFDQE